VALHVIKLHKGQVKVRKSKARFRVVVAGRRWGKTHLSGDELFEGACRKKKALIWYVAPTYSMARDIMWQKLLDIIPPRLIRRKNETRLSIRLVNGSEIQLKGADKPDTLRGRGVDFVVLDEYQDFKDGAWDEVIFPTLTDKGGRALIIGTPKAYNCLYDAYIKGQDKTKHPDWESWQFPTITSPFIPKREIETARQNLDPKTFRQEFEASFETMSGRVYYPFDRKIHVGDYNLDPNKPILVGQDFNVDPMCSVILQWHPEKDELWVVDEIFLPQSSTVETANELERRYWRHIKSRRLAIYPDPAGAYRSSARGETDLEVFREKGITHIYYRRKHPLVSDRVNSVNALLRAADGRIRLKISHRCLNLINGLEQTIYKPNSREVDKAAGHEHMPDGLGYPCEYLFPASRVRIMGTSL
jgi:hypothetical protein